MLDGKREFCCGKVIMCLCPFRLLPKVAPTTLHSTFCRIIPSIITESNCVLDPDKIYAAPFLNGLEFTRKRNMPSVTYIFKLVLFKSFGQLYAGVESNGICIIVNQFEVEKKRSIAKIIQKVGKQISRNDKYKT